MISRSVQISLLIFLCVVIISVQSAARDKDVVIVPLIDLPEESVYFSQLVQLVDGAKKKIEIMMATISFSDLSPGSCMVRILDKLKDAHSRGVEIKIILDNSDWSPSISQKNMVAADYLRKIGADVKLDDPETTTHAKFVVVDESTVILGSSNWNENSFNQSFQTNVLIENKTVGKFYSDFFEILWTKKRFQPNLPQHNVTLNQTVIPMASFGKSRLYNQLLIGLIKGARDSISVLMYQTAFYPQYNDSPSNDVLQQLIDARNRGIRVRIIFEKTDWLPGLNENNLRTAWWLSIHGVTVRFDPPESFNHSKLVIIDGRTVLLGSSNWNYYSLARNNETDVALINFEGVGPIFKSYFHRLWESATPLVR